MILMWYHRDGFYGVSNAPDNHEKYTQNIIETSSNTKSSCVMSEQLNTLLFQQLTFKAITGLYT